MTPQATTTKQAGLRLRFLSEIYAEMKKVVWLSRREAAYLTLLVLIVSVAVGVMLGILDYGFSALVEKIFLGK